MAGFLHTNSTTATKTTTNLERKWDKLVVAVINGKQFKLSLDAITAMPSYTFAQLHGSNQDYSNQDASPQCYQNQSELEYRSQLSSMFFWC